MRWLIWILAVILSNDFCETYNRDCLNPKQNRENLEQISTQLQEVMLDIGYQKQLLNGLLELCFADPRKIIVVIIGISAAITIKYVYRSGKGIEKVIQVVDKSSRSEITNKLFEQKISKDFNMRKKKY